MEDNLSSKAGVAENNKITLTVGQRCQLDEVVVIIVKMDDFIFQLHFLKHMLSAKC